MYLYEIAYDSFVLAQANWTVDKIQQLLKCLKPSHIIVKHYLKEVNDKKINYYLYELDVLSKQLLNSHSTSKLQKVLDLEKHAATPVYDAHSDAEASPDLCVIIDKGWIVGFYDACVPPSFRQKRGNDEPLLSDEIETRSLMADFPKQVALGDTASLIVTLSAEDIIDQDLLISLGRWKIIIIQFGLSI